METLALQLTRISTATHHNKHFSWLRDYAEAHSVCINAVLTCFIGTL